MSSWVCVTQNHVVTTSNYFIIMNYNSTKRASIFAILPLYMLLQQLFIKNTPNYSLKLQPAPISLISPTWLAFMHILVELTKKMIYLTTRALLNELNHSIKGNDRKRNRREVKLRTWNGCQNLPNEKKPRDAMCREADNLRSLNCDDHYPQKWKKVWN